MRGALSAHEQIYDEEKKRSQPSTVDGFLKRLAPPQEEPQAGPSGDGPKEAPLPQAATAPRALTFRQVKVGKRRTETAPRPARADTAARLCLCF